MAQNLLKIYEASFRNNFALPALTDYVTGKTITYGDFAKKIARIHLLFDGIGVKQGDKIVLLGKNTPEWVAVFMATLTFGAVIVPVLDAFNPRDAQHIINHSDAVLLFVSESIYEHLEFDEMPKIRAVFSLDRHAVLAERMTVDKADDTGKDNIGAFNIDTVVNGPEQRLKRKSKSGRASTVMTALRSITRRFNKQYPKGFGPLDVLYPETGAEELAVINYTSGTTGFSKGVMLTHNNLLGNVVFGIDSKLHYKGSRALSFLPLAHAYGCAFDMLVPLAVGSHITLLGKTPTPRILVKAMGEVKPSLIICVPLILEKIYKNMIVPMITKAPLSWVLAVPGLDMAIYSRIKSRLVEAFGGEFEEVIVGGAPLNGEVEAFLKKIHFPFTVGYGMTECGPLISYTPWREFILDSSGHTLRGIMTAKIQHADGSQPDCPGEICVKGQNVMKGYYKNPEATEAVLDPDGWLHTGDMGNLGGPDGQTIFIRGRYKTMILSANGQNIYPEEIEAKLNNMPYVGESLVVDRGGHLVALVYPDTELADRNGISITEVAKLMETTRSELNKLLAPYEKIERIQLVPQEFEKTPKRSIKRYLYS